MGNQQSKHSSKSSAPAERSSRSHRPQEEERDLDKEAERERENKMMGRRRSIQALSHTKATAADPSPSTESAVAQPILQPPGHKPSLQQHLPSMYPQSPLSHERTAGSAVDPKSLAERRVEANGAAVERGKDGAASRVSEATVEPSNPMDVPAHAHDRSNDRSKRSSVAGSTSSKSTPQASTPQYAPNSGFKRPPRLPLAIADEIHAPESPALEPTAIPSGEISIFEDDDAEATVPRKSSMLSSVAADEDDEASELQVYAVDTGAVDIVPTRIDWKGRGEKVYVTGTFAHWDKKFRLHPSERGPGMTATIGFPPGTHHLKFIVDGNMVASPDLPTTVDIHNVLVNYIEVVRDGPGRARGGSSYKIKPAPAHVYPPIALPSDEEMASGQVTPEQADEPFEPPEEEIPVGDFRALMPQALTDMELPEDDPRFRQAYKIINDTPGPPSLPLFLGKSILNGILPHKDDNSVLTLPNHTVLNHLATSSIKNGVLATSVTTRYKKKYVTTIMYKPTLETGEGRR